MLRIETGNSSRYCDGWSRRSFVQIGMAGIANVPLSALLRAKEQSVATGSPVKDTSTILVWLDGGPSHIDTYDTKPLAPEQYRGLWKPIATNVSGIDVTELFPQHAKLADKFSLIRSIHHDNQGHFAGAHYMLTGRGGAGGGNKPIKFPSIGSVVSKFAADRRPGFPPYISVPVGQQHWSEPWIFRSSFSRFNAGSVPNRR